MHDRISKLPMWAQQEFTRLERRANEAEKTLAEHITRGDFVRGDYNNCRVPNGVTLHSSESAVARGAVRVNFDKDSQVEVSTSGRLHIETQASNIVVIRSEGAL